MIRHFVFGLLVLAIGYCAIAFQPQQSLQRRTFFEQKSINNELSTTSAISNSIQIIGGKRRFWQLCSSVQDDFDVAELVEADQDPDQEEDANFQNEEEIERFFAEAERDVSSLLRCSLSFVFVPPSTISISPSAKPLRSDISISFNRNHSSENLGTFSILRAMDLIRADEVSSVPPFVDSACAGSFPEMGDALPSFCMGRII